MSSQQPAEDRAHSRAVMRLSWAAVLAALFALCAGACSAPAAASHGKALGAKGLLPSAVRNKSEQEALRKAVEADSFPTAAQAGL